MRAGDIISYTEMCGHEAAVLQAGMNYRLKGKQTVILMSLRPNAPYADRIEDEGRVLIYEGHDVPRYKNLKRDPKRMDQPMHTPRGKLTQNGYFFEAAKRTEAGKAPETVRVYEKIRPAIWCFNGVFNLVAAKVITEKGRKVFKFRLLLTDQNADAIPKISRVDLTHERIIPSHVKLAVWKRDKGKCVQCGSSDNLHFDHILPFSKGGSSIIEKNVQLLCARHNLSKSDKIE